MPAPWYSRATCNRRRVPSRRVRGQLYFPRRDGSPRSQAAPTTRQALGRGRGLARQARRQPRTARPYVRASSDSFVNSAASVLVNKLFPSRFESTCFTSYGTLSEDYLT